MTTNPGDRISVIDGLRAFAALSVAFYHFSNGNSAFLPDSFLKDIGSYGWAGVQMFFVVSGFILPYSLHRVGYTRVLYPKFIWKRILRLDPPYLASIAIALVIGYATRLIPSYQGASFSPELGQTLAHVGYLNAILGYDWLSGVYWTLAIEFQFYLCIGLLFPFFASPHAATRGIVMALAAAAAFLHFDQPQFLPFWSIQFLFGILVFQMRAQLWQPVEGFVLLAAFAGLSFWRYGDVSTIYCLAAALLILWNPMVKNAGILFFGRISYSLYLLHAMIGIKLVNIGSRFAHTWPSKLLVIVIAFGASVLAAWLLYRFLERPSQAWSSRIRLTPRHELPTKNISPKRSRS